MARFQLNKADLLNSAKVIATEVFVRRRNFLPSATVYGSNVALHRSSSLHFRHKTLLTFAKECEQRLPLLTQTSLVRRESKGFMLMEVLVAVGILAFGLIYISRAYMSCLNAMSQVANYTTAAILAEEKLFEVETNREKFAQASESGNFSVNPNFNYSLESKKIDDSDLNDVFLQVNWKEGRRVGSIEAVSYLYAKPKK